MSRAVAGDVKATGRDRTVITKAGKRSFFSRVSAATLATATTTTTRQDGYLKGSPKIDFFRVSEATLGSFPGHFWSVFGTKLGGVSAFRVVSMRRAVAADVKATGRDRRVISKAAKRCFFSRVSEATLGTFSGHFWSVLGTKLGGVSAFRVVSEENKTKELEFHVEILWDSLGFRAS